MGRRSDFPRRPMDAYATPAEAVGPLLPHLTKTRFIEPCAGDGALVILLNNAGLFCAQASDIAPRRPDVVQRDARTSIWPDLFASVFITNPPWTRRDLHPIIINLSNQKPTWLLFDAAWLFTGQAAPYVNRIRKIVSVGRVKWIAGSPHAGKDDAVWYLFDKPQERIAFEFVPTGGTENPTDFELEI